MDVAAWLAVAKVAHLGSLVVWLGPSGGAWLMLTLQRTECGDPSAVSHYLYRGFLKLMWLQHAGLLLLLASGLFLLYLYGFALLEYRWLQLKLLLVLTVVVPIEVGDMWFGHARLPPIFAAREPGAAYGPEEQRALRFYNRYFVPVGLAVLLPTVAVIMWLALARPA